LVLIVIIFFGAGLIASSIIGRVHELVILICALIFGFFIYQANNKKLNEDDRGYNLCSAAFFFGSFINMLKTYDLMTYDKYYISITIFIIMIVICFAAGLLYKKYCDKKERNILQPLIYMFGITPLLYIINVKING
jgi:hypothetical protein